jgi:phosphatidylserine decarboxylase
MTQFERERPQDYLNFDDFFTRNVKKEARPLASPEDDTVVVSACDCRLMAFDTIDKAKNLLIKGAKFSLTRLVGGRNDLVEKFKNGPVVNFRLTPADYHHVHSPLAGTITEHYQLPGEYFTTEVKALKSPVDILDVNERHILVVNSVSPGGPNMLMAIIGAEQVGKVNMSKTVGDNLIKGEEIAVFDFGASDVLVMFDKEVTFDYDILHWSNQGIETLINFNERIGTFKS